jgi:hypothetical protein
MGDEKCEAFDVVPTHVRTFIPDATTPPLWRERFGSKLKINLA